MNEVFEELRAALHSIWHRRWIVLGVTWAVCLAGWLAVALIPNAYESKARIFVQLDDVLSEQIGIAGGSAKAIERVRQTLTSAVNLEKVVRSTRLGDEVTTPREMEAAVGALTQAVKVRSDQENLFELSAAIGKRSLSDAENAALAQEVVQKMIDIFREENIAGNRGEVADTLVFLDQQLEQRARELEAAEQARTAFEAQHPELIGGAAAISSKMQAARAELRGVDADLAAASSALAAINGQLAGTPRTVTMPGQQVQGGAHAALSQAQAQLAAMQARGLTESHPDVIAARRQVQLMQRAAAQEGNGGGAISSPNPAYSSLLSIKAERQANLQALQARKAALQADVSAIYADQASEPALAAEANRISRDYEVLKTKYDELLQDREEMKLRGQVESERSSFKFEVIDPPSTPRVPASPNRPLLLIGVLLAGLAAGAGLAFALGHLRSTFATAARLEAAMGLPVIATISHTFTDGKRALCARRQKMFYAASGGLAALLVLLLAAEFLQRGMVA